MPPEYCKAFARLSVVKPSSPRSPAIIAVALLSVLAAAPLSAQADREHYRMDAAATTITARVTFFGLATKTAGFPAVSGGIALDPRQPEAIALDILLDARQLTAGDAVTLARLKGPNFFDVARYPEVRFVGTRIVLGQGNSARITGTLTARGVTRPVVLSALFAAPPRPGEPLTLTATTAIDRRDFGMTAYPFIVGSKVRITITARLMPD